MKRQIKIPLLVFAIGAFFLGLRVSGAQQGNNQSDPNAPRGVISGLVLEQGRGVPVKKATVQLRRVNNNNQQQAQPVQNQGAQAGAAGTTLGSTLGGTVGTTAGGTQTQGRGANPQGTNQPNNNSNNNQNPRGGGGGGGNGQQEIQTGNDGFFTFNDVAAGDYVVSVSLDQYLTLEYGQRTMSGKGTPISLQAGARLDNINFQMVKAGVVSGVVVDEDGLPMSGVQVQALAFDYRNGQRTLRATGTARTTNDLGEYRLYYLSPGEYYIAAKVNNNNGNNNGQNRGGNNNPRAIIETLSQADREQLFAAVNGGNNGGGGRGNFEQALQGLATSGSVSPRVQEIASMIARGTTVPDPTEGYAPAFYPGTSDPSQAAAVVVPPAGDIRGVDIGFKLSPAVTVTGVVLQPAVQILPRQQQNQNNNQTNNNNNNNNNQQQANSNNNNNRQTGNNNNQQQASSNNNNNNRPTGNNNNQQQASNNNNNNNRPTGNNNNQQQASSNNNNNNRPTGNNNNTQQQTNNNNNNNRNNTQQVTQQQSLIRPDLMLVPLGVSYNGRGGNNNGGRGGNNGGGGNNSGVTGRTTIKDDGSFQMTGVMPGMYNLIAVGEKENVLVTATQRVDVGFSGNVTGVTLALRPGVVIPGRIYRDGELPPNEQLRNMRVRLELADEVPGARDVQVDVNADDTFLLQDVVPGVRYRVRFQVSGPAFLKAGVYGSEEALNSNILVADGGTPLSLQIGFSPGRVDATVSDGDKPQQGILTVLVPKERGRVDLYKTGNSDKEGKVAFSNVTPGDYKLFAWEEVKQFAWQDIAYMEKFEDKGRLIHVEKGGASAETVKVIKSDDE